MKDPFFNPNPSALRALPEPNPDFCLSSKNHPFPEREGERKKKIQSGSSLLEVLVAIIIFSMVFLALNNVLLISVRASASYRSDIQMQDITRNTLTSQFLKNSETVKSIRQYGKNYFNELKVIQLPASVKDPPYTQDLCILYYEKDLYKITVRTYREEKGKKRSKELTTLMDVR